MVRMKTYSTRHRRPHLIPVPYSIRPDHLDRGLRMLRALRLKLQATPGQPPRVAQFEFDFRMSKRA
jgi:hypothetical protein